MTTSSAPVTSTNIFIPSHNAPSSQTRTAIARNSVIHGDCLKVMRTLAAGSVDFILTDPPYLVSYKSRDNRQVRNDDNADWLQPAYAEMYRVLKSNALAVSFYGWPKTDLFFAAWKRAGFRVGGHIVFRKNYTSKSGFLQYRHESAYLLLKGNPPRPESPLPDVLDWSYTGNKLHPTQKSVRTLAPIIQAFTQPGEIVLDPFAGSGSTCVAAQTTGRDYIGIELDEVHHRTATARLAGNISKVM